MLLQFVIIQGRNDTSNDDLIWRNNKQIIIDYNSPIGEVINGIVLLIILLWIIPILPIRCFIIRIIK
jgi:hypothetical protein